ncbi:dihydroneopterin aldolase [Mariprofundus erugo]|uniref:7,8-dihydroneopterin aldolase n=1 Tax=Mariprofundus erugo TaxID=2528639 RepID=A0A5R9GDT6_9PROT|nr:dihydroneopterin aldolase [Mariprofundus erugo]TLS76968.1 dihydroneopterin aldolase [Mariprofundus erugo]
MIEGLEIATVIGIYDWERDIQQRIRLDIEMLWDISKAAASDDIRDALDYHAITTRLLEYVESASFGLIESLAEGCAGIILNEFSVPWLRLKLSKPLPDLGMKHAAIVIERGVLPG